MLCRRVGRHLQVRRRQRARRDHRDRAGLLVHGGLCRQVGPHPDSVHGLRDDDDAARDFGRRVSAGAFFVSSRRLPFFFILAPRVF